jgi:hypothetical protein
MHKIMKIPQQNILITVRPLFRSWYDVIETYRKIRCKMFGSSDLTRLVRLIYKNPMTIRELSDMFQFPYNAYQERRLRLTLATLVTTGIVDVSRRLNYCSGRPPTQYEAKCKTITEYVKSTSNMLRNK